MAFRRPDDVSNIKTNTMIPLPEEPAEVAEETVEETRRVKFDRRNPWGQVAEEWAGGSNRRPREYQIDLEHLDKPARM